MVPSENMFLCAVASCHLCEGLLHISATALIHNSSQQAKCRGRALVGGWTIPGAVLNWASCSALASVLLTQRLDNPGLAPSHVVKCLMEGWGTLMPLPAPQLLPWERLMDR